MVHLSGVSITGDEVMHGQYLEVVVYGVEDALAADHEREAALGLVSALPGFISWTRLSGADDARERVDLVAWSSLEDARAAALVVGADPRLAPFRATVSRFDTMGHYTSADDAPGVVPAAGIEIGRFRLKPGADRGAMVAAYRAMVANHLALQAGWRDQHLVELEDGAFVDLAFSETPARAKQICELWQGNADCDAFLAMVECSSMEFGRVADR